MAALNRSIHIIVTHSLGRIIAIKEYHCSRVIILGVVEDAAIQYTDLLFYAKKCLSIQPHHNHSFLTLT